MITGQEGVSFDIEGKVIPDSVEQGTGTMVVEQHGSLLKAIDTSDGEEIHLGSTPGNNIILTNGGYAEVPGMLNLLVTELSRKEQMGLRFI